MKAHHESRASDEYRKMASTSPLKAKMCKELSSFGLQDAIKCQLLCIAHCALRKTKQTRIKPLSRHCHPGQKRCQSTSHHRATRGCTGGWASRNLRPRESVGGCVSARSSTFLVDALALYRNKVLWSSITIWALQIDGAHVAAHPWIWHHSASIVGSSCPLSATNGRTLLTREATICRHIHSPAPCGTTGCKTGKDLECQCTHSSCNCFRHHDLRLSRGSAKSHGQMSGNLSQSNRAETQGNVLAVLYPKTIQTVLHLPTLNSGFVGSQFKLSALKDKKYKRRESKDHATKIYAKLQFQFFWNRSSLTLCGKSAKRGKVQLTNGDPF